MRVRPRAEETGDIAAAWALRNNVQISTGTRCPCRLTRRTCGYRMDECCRPPGDDHGSLWNKNGKPWVYVFQPYGIDAAALGTWCDAHGLTAFIDVKPAWHGHGVLHVELKRRQR